MPRLVCHSAIAARDATAKDAVDATSVEPQNGQIVLHAAPLRSGQRQRFLGQPRPVLRRQAKGGDTIVRLRGENPVGIATQIKLVGVHRVQTACPLPERPFDQVRGRRGRRGGRRLE